MAFSKRIMVTILMQFAIASQIFASDNPFNGDDARIKCATSEAFAMLQSGISDINQLVDIDTGHPTQNGWSVVRSTADTIYELYKAIDSFTNHRISRTALWIIGFAINMDSAVSHAFKDTKTGNRYIYAKAKTREFYRYYYQNIYP